MKGNNRNSGVIIIILTAVAITAALSIVPWGRLTGNILKDFKAVQEGQVYCTTNDMYQQSMAIGYLLQDMHTVLTDDDTAKLRYLFLLQ